MKPYFWPPLSSKEALAAGFSACNRRAFSLIELLVASTVSLLLVGILLSVAQNIMASYKGAEGAIIRRGDISFAIDQVIQDLEGLVIPNVPGAEALRITPETLGPQNASSQWLTLLATATDKDPSSPVDFSGATRAISYRLAYQDPVVDAGTNPVYALYRSIGSSAHTFKNAVGKTNLQSDYWASPPAAPAPTPPPPTHIDNFLAGNVVRFQVRFLRADTKQWTEPGQTIHIGRDETSVDGSPIPGGFLRAEVAITALSSEGMQRLGEGFPLEEAITRFGQTSVRQTAFF